MIGLRDHSGHKVLVLTSLLAMFLASPASAQDSTAIVRAKLVPEKAWVGQRVNLEVTVLVATFFGRAPRFTLPQVPGALLFETGDRPINLTESIEGSEYSGTTTSLTLFPQRAGTLAIPPITVRMGISTGAGKPAHELTLATEELRLEVEAPPGAEGLGTIISTREFEVTDSWDPDITEARVGDALVRTVTRRAPDILGMAFPPLPAREIEGLGIYSREPEVEDTIERGEFRGQRRERITYVCERPGTYTLPALLMPWFDLESKEMKRVTLEARTLVVAPNPDLNVTSSTAIPQRRSWLGTGVLLAALSVISMLAWWRRTAIQGTWRRWRRTRREREPAIFARLLEACRSGDPRRADAAITRWLGRTHSGSETPTLTGLATEIGDSSLAREAGRLQRALLDAASAWDGAPLARVLEAARTTTFRNWADFSRESLPALNPLEPSSAHRSFT